MPLPKIEFIAPEIRAAITQLQTYMPGQVEQLNDEGYAQIIAPATFHFGGQDMLNAYEFPQIEVAAVAGDTGNFGIARTEVDHDPKMNIAVWQIGDIGDIPTLYEQTLGMIRCVIECMVPPGAFGAEVEIAQEAGISWRADVIPHDPTATTPDKGRDFQKWLGSGLIQFKLEKVEHFT